MEQELSAVVGENEQLIQQRPTQDNESVWEQRYQELLGKYKSFLFLVSSHCKRKWDNYKPTAVKEAFPKNNTPNSKITAPNYNTNTSKPSTSSRCIAKAATANKSKTKCKPTCRKSKPTRIN
jgi:hypothetical protein